MHATERKSFFDAIKELCSLTIASATQILMKGKGFCIMEISLKKYHKFWT